MNQIGFRAGPEIGSNYRMDEGSQSRDEMERRITPLYAGRANSVEKLSRQEAEEWMSGLENEDGTKGPHWTLEQVKQVMAQKGIQEDPFEFWATLNSMYADYCKVFKKHGVGEKLDFYIDMAKAFIDDKDAGKGKVANYFRYIVR